LVVLAACAPDLGPPPVPQTIQDTTRSFTAAESPWPANDWWKAYGDQELDTLIDEALAGAPDLRIAEARLKEAEAAAQQAGAALYPDVTGEAAVQPTRQTLNQGFPEAFKPLLPRGWHSASRAAVNLDYTLDFFGKNHAALAAATSEAQAAKVDEAAARIELSTSVASAYADLVRLTADRDAAADAVRVREESAKLVEDRVNHQLENAGQLSQSRAEFYAAKADLDAIEGEIALTRNQIAALLGRGPDRGLDVPLPKNPNLAPQGLPSKLAVDLVGRRPDLVAARLRAEAASDEIKVAHADFYPNIDLTGYFGVQSLDIKSLLQKDSLIGQIGPALRLPIFDGGRIEGAYRGARASYDEAVATYDKTLTGALHEVADALANQRETANALGHSRAALAEGENAYRVAVLRYKAGLSRYLEVLTAEDTLLTERRNVADLEARAFSQNVALVRALGGGFSEQA
jgi:NodT family efflux transporter outer membrane factor (OMF) lipoprotein